MYEKIRRLITYLARISVSSAIFVLTPTMVCAHALDVEVQFAWTDEVGCPECTIARLRLAIEGTKVSASSVMLEDYADIDTNHNISIEVEGKWTCDNHTQGQSAPDPHNWGVNYEVCVKLLGRKATREFTIDYVSKITNPGIKYKTIFDVIFKIEITSPNSCEAFLLSARSQYAIKPGVWMPAIAPTQQRCYFVTPG